MSGVGFVMGVETLWGDVWARVGLIMGDGGVLNCSIMLGFENEVVECSLAPFGVASSANMAVMGLGGVGWGWVKFGHGRGIVGWLRGSGGREHVLRHVIMSNCCWCHCGCAKSGWWNFWDFKQDFWIGT